MEQVAHHGSAGPGQPQRSVGSQQLPERVSDFVDIACRIAAVSFRPLIEYAVHRSARHSGYAVDKFPLAGYCHNEIGFRLAYNLDRPVTAQRYTQFTAGSFGQLDKILYRAPAAPAAVVYIPDNPVRAVDPLQTMRQQQQHRFRRNPLASSPHPRIVPRNQPAVDLGLVTAAHPAAATPCLPSHFAQHVCHKFRPLSS